MMKRARIVLESVFLWLSPIFVVPKKSQLGEQPQKHIYVNYHALNSLLLPIVKIHSKAQSILFSVALPK